MESVLEALWSFLQRVPIENTVCLYNLQFIIELIQFIEVFVLDEYFGGALHYPYRRASAAFAYDSCELHKL